MHQADMWHDTIFDALGAAVQAAGGPKKVAGKLWPALDSTSATARLRACMNPEHAQKLCLDEFVLIQRLARDSGDTSVLQFQAREMGCKLEMLSPAEAKKQAKRARRLALLDELMRLEEE